MIYIVGINTHEVVSLKTKICTTCMGQKKIKGMGFTDIDCPSCKATGKIELDHWVCEICKKEIAKDAVQEAVETVKKTRARRQASTVISTDDMSIGGLE